jgi:hypothetical protein
MVQSVMKKWPRGTLLQEVILTLKAPDAVWTKKEMSDQGTRAPADAEFAITYNYASAWNDLVNAAVFFFDRDGKLLSADSRVY